MKEFLKKLYPFLSTAAGTVGGPLGSVAANALGKALGIDKADPGLDELGAAYATATPEQRLAAAKEEHDFAEKMQAAGYDHAEKLETLAATDRDSARKREMTVRDKIPAALAIGVTVGFFGLLFFLLRHSPPADSKDVLNIMLGSLGTAWVSIIAYYFGSSAGSAAKNEMLANAGKQ